MNQQLFIRFVTTPVLSRAFLSLRRGIFWVIGWVLLLAGIPVEASVLAKADFESGRLSGWTIFTTPNGTLGGEGFPLVVDDDVAGAGQISRCWQVKVGQIQYSPDQDPQQGGGLEIRQDLSQGRLRLSALVMATYYSPKDKRNLAGGQFEWVVDGQVVAMKDMGPIENGATLRHHLLADLSVETGPHVMQLRISRPFKSGTGQQAPLQLVDDLTLEWAPPP